MKLILTRHGKTEANEKRRIGGDADKHSRQGKKQIKMLANRLKKEKIDAIFSSPILRAKETTLEIAKFHKNIPIFFVEELREGQAKSFEGKSYEEANWSNPPKDIETKESINKRAKKILNKAYKTYPTKTVLFVGHSAINKAILKIITNKDRDLKQENTAINIFEIKDKRHKIHCINCTKHLNKE